MKGIEMSVITLRNGVEVPAVGAGTWPFKGPDASEAVKSALEMGYRHIDTAEAYGNEEAVAQGMRAAAVPREDVFLTTKLSKGFHGEQQVQRGFEAAARRLGVEYLDLYLIHWPNPDLGLFVETCAGLQSLEDAGHIRSWGVSNFKDTHLAPVLAQGLEPRVNQIQVQPYGAQRALQRVNAEHHITTAAYSPLGRGGEVLQDPTIADIARTHGVTPAQVILRWHVQQGRIVVPRSANEQRRRENISVFGFQLTEAELERIDQLDQDQPPQYDADTFGH